MNWSRRHHQSSDWRWWAASDVATSDWKRQNRTMNLPLRASSWCFQFTDLSLIRAHLCASRAAHVQTQQRHRSPTSSLIEGNFFIISFKIQATFNFYSILSSLTFHSTSFTRFSAFLPSFISKSFSLLCLLLFSFFVGLLTFSFFSRNLFFIVVDFFTFVIFFSATFQRCSLKLLVLQFESSL